MATRTAGEVPLPDGTWGPAPTTSTTSKPRMKGGSAVSKKKQAIKAALAKAETVVLRRGAAKPGL